MTTRPRLKHCAWITKMLYSHCVPVPHPVKLIILLIYFQTRCVFPDSCARWTTPTSPEPVDARPTTARDPCRLFSLCLSWPRGRYIFHETRSQRFESDSVPIIPTSPDPAHTRLTTARDLCSYFANMFTMTKSMLLLLSTESDFNAIKNLIPV